MRTPTLILAVAAFALPFDRANSQDEAKQPTKLKSRQTTEKVREFQRERIATLKTMAEVETSLHRSGESSLESVLEAKVLVCEGELDAAVKDSDRIAVLKSLVAVLQELETTAKARKQAARASEVSVLKVKARRLEAEIRLEQAQVQERGQAKNVEPEDESVVVTSLKAMDVVIAEQFACQVNSRRHIDIRSQQSGYLEEIQVKEGQTVKQGDVMFRIAPLRYKAKLDAELAEVDIAAIGLKNTERLFQNKVVSAEEMALAKAKLAVAQAKAKLAQAELDLTLVRAPFDGIIDRLQTQLGSLVTEREILTTLSDNSVMWVYFDVSQARYLEFMSDPAKDRLIETQLVLAGNRVFPQAGKLASIEAQFNRETGNIPFRADFPNPDGLLRHGMTGKILIKRALSSAIVIPQRATTEIRGMQYVYVVNKEDVAHRREIVIQSESGDDFVIKKGLGVDDRIVVDGVRRIHDGEKLKYELQPSK